MHRFCLRALLGLALSLAGAPALAQTDEARAAAPDDGWLQVLATRCEPMDVLVVVADHAKDFGVTPRVLRDPLVAMLSAGGVYGTESSTDQALLISAEVYGDRLRIDMALARTVLDAGYGRGGMVVVYRDTASATHEGDFNRFIEAALLSGRHFRDLYLSVNEESCSGVVPENRIELAVGIGETKPEACLAAHETVNQNAQGTCGGDSLDHHEWIDCPAGRADIRCIARSCYCALRPDSSQQCTILWRCRHPAESGDFPN